MVRVGDAEHGKNCGTLLATGHTESQTLRKYETLPRVVIMKTLPRVVIMKPYLEW